MSISINNIDMNLFLKYFTDEYLSQTNLTMLTTKSPAIFYKYTIGNNSVYRSDKIVDLEDTVNIFGEEMDGTVKLTTEQCDGIYKNLAIYVFGKKSSLYTANEYTYIDKDINIYLNVKFDGSELRYNDNVRIVTTSLISSGNTYYHSSIETFFVYNDGYLIGYLVKNVALERYSLTDDGRIRYQDSDGNEITATIGSSNNFQIHRDFIRDEIYKYLDTSALLSEIGENKLGILDGSDLNISYLERFTNKTHYEVLEREEEDSLPFLEQIPSAMINADGSISSHVIEEEATKTSTYCELYKMDVNSVSFRNEYKYEGSDIIATGNVIASFPNIVIGSDNSELSDGDLIYNEDTLNITYFDAIEIIGNVYRYNTMVDSKLPIIQSITDTDEPVQLLNFDDDVQTLYLDVTDSTVNICGITYDVTRISTPLSLSYEIDDGIEDMRETIANSIGEVIIYKVIEMYNQEQVYDSTNYIDVVEYETASTTFLSDLIGSDRYDSISSGIEAVAMAVKYGVDTGVDFASDIITTSWSAVKENVGPVLSEGLKIFKYNAIDFATDLASNVVSGVEFIMNTALMTTVTSTIGSLVDGYKYISNDLTNSVSLWLEDVVSENTVDIDVSDLINATSNVLSVLISSMSDELITYTQLERNGEVQFIAKEYELSSRKIINVPVARKFIKDKILIGQLDEMGNITAPKFASPSPSLYYELLGYNESIFTQMTSSEGKIVYSYNVNEYANPFNVNEKIKIYNTIEYADERVIETIECERAYTIEELVTHFKANNRYVKDKYIDSRGEVLSEVSVLDAMRNEITINLKRYYDDNTSTFTVNNLFDDEFDVKSFNCEAITDFINNDSQTESFTKTKFSNLRDTSRIVLKKTSTIGTDIDTIEFDSYELSSQEEHISTFDYKNKTYLEKLHDAENFATEDNKLKVIKKEALYDKMYNDYTKTSPVHSQEKLEDFVPYANTVSVMDLKDNVAFLMKNFFYRKTDSDANFVEDYGRFMYDKIKNASPTILSDGDNKNDYNIISVNETDTDEVFELNMQEMIKLVLDEGWNLQ